MALQSSHARALVQGKTSRIPPRVINAALSISLLGSLQIAKLKPPKTDATLCLSLSFSLSLQLVIKEDVPVQLARSHYHPRNKRITSQLASAILSKTDDEAQEKTLRACTRLFYRTARARRGRCIYADIHIGIYRAVQRRLTARRRERR